MRLLLLNENIINRSGMESKSFILYAEGGDGDCRMAWF